MLKIYGPAFCHAAIIIGRAQLMTDTIAGKYPTLKTLKHTDNMGDENRKTIGQRMTELANLVEGLGAPVTKRAAEDMARALGKTDPYTFAQLGNDIRYLEKTLQIELEKTALFALRPDKRHYWLQDKPLFGPEVDERFPDSIDDIVGSGKCLAAEQGTASVFHAMRVMEDGLKQLAKPLGIPYAPSWESYIRQITKIFETPYKKRAANWKKNGSFFRDVLGDLQSVKFAWRNPTMHIVKKYTPDEAEDIFRSVRTFMQRLAAGLPPLKPKRALS
ncbi:MAG: hypothetical protein Q8N31_04690 [Reyranella sp.]|nr:hypothetical protein [Reyranella sp.]MDP3159289.1 hypothetical protein [Reyranella sp.]